jgi:hypothetical protein
MSFLVEAMTMVFFRGGRSAGGEWVPNVVPAGRQKERQYRKKTSANATESGSRRALAFRANNIAIGAQMVWLGYVGRNDAGRIKGVDDVGFYVLV